jgi:hypothetical protein
MQRIINLEGYSFSHKTGEKHVCTKNSKSASRRSIDL